MEIRDAQLLLQSLEVLIKQADVSMCADLADAVDFHIRREIVRVFPKLKRTGV